MLTRAQLCDIRAASQAIFTSAFQQYSVSVKQAIILYHQISCVPIYVAL